MNKMHSLRLSSVAALGCSGGLEADSAIVSMPGAFIGCRFGSLLSQGEQSPRHHVAFFFASGFSRMACRIMGVPCGAASCRAVSLRQSSNPHGAARPLEGAAALGQHQGLHAMSNLKALRARVLRASIPLHPLAASCRRAVAHLLLRLAASAAPIAACRLI